MRPLVLVTVVLLAGLVACDGRVERSSAAAAKPARGANAEAPATETTPGEGGFSSEAERTRAMEAQAGDLERQFEESMAGAATEEEKIRAYQEFEQGRQELNEISEEGDDTDAYGPPPRP